MSYDLDADTLVIPVRELDLSIISTSSKIVAIGKPGTGKSSVITALLYYKKHIYPVIQIYSGTENPTNHFSQYVGDVLIYPELSEEGVKNFIKRQLLAKKYLEVSAGILVIDDCTDDPKILNKPLFQKLYKNGRHFDMLFILSLQYALDIKPNIRNNIDGVFIMREPNVLTRKKLWENYASVIPTFKIFCKIMDEITTDFTALYIHNQTQTNDFRDCIYYYKAPVNLPKYKWFGSEYCKDFSDTRYNPDYTYPII
jgi:GTPase SAR1 family protein